jgi:predicted dehydrogenase
MRIGLIGYDTSHSYVFPQRLKELAEQDARFKDLAVTHGWPGDPETAVHPESLDTFRQKIDALGIEPVESLEQLVDQCDAFLLESVNGDTHLEQAKVVLPAGKPTYIDKPFANNVDDAQAIIALARKHNTPCWSSSSLRFEPNMLAALEEAGEEVTGINVHGPAKYFPKGRGLVYYGIHPAEIVFKVMGRGLRSVQTTWHEDWEVVVGTWDDGRMATLRGDRKTIKRFGGTIYGTNVVHFKAEGDFYGALCKTLAEFLVTGETPVPLDETLEVIAFLDGAVRSREAGGERVSIELD